MKRLLPLLQLVLFSTLLYGCTTNLENTTARPSPYQGDSILYRADQAIVSGYDFLKLYVTWEYQNRFALAGTPEIKQSADVVRAHAKEWISSAQKLREAYKLNPTEPNKTALQTSLDIISQALTEAMGYFTKFGPAKKG